MNRNLFLRINELFFDKFPSCVISYLIKIKKMNTNKAIKHSKFLSLILRHKPETIGVSLDANGWIDIDILIEKMNDYGRKINREELLFVVENNPKKRFAINELENKIRANQGHSIDIDHGFQPIQPPEKLYHGTAQRFLDSIFGSGLEKRNRHHVHLSSDLTTASQVGLRHGKLVILEVQALKMHQDGFEFYQSENGVWLTDKVPAKYLINSQNND